MPQSKANRTGITLFDENQCVPCLLTNVSLLIVVSTLISYFSVLGGVITTISGGVIILFKGYLVPYTPTFAPQLVNRLPWDLFDKDVQKSDSLVYRNSKSGEQLMRDLIQEQVITSNEEELLLTDEFKSRWTARMHSLRDVSTDRIGQRLRDAIPGATESTVSKVNDNTYIVLSNKSDDLKQESWLSPPVAISETAAAELLQDTSLEPERRAEAAHLLTMFSQSCPACGTEVVEEPAGGCCGPPQIGPDGDPLIALVCKNCSVQLFTFEP